MTRPSLDELIPWEAGAEVGVGAFLLLATHNQIIRKILKSKQGITFCYHKNIFELQKCKNNCTCPNDPSKFG